MKHISTAAACLLALMCAMQSAYARPPTVVTSPGYDARLAESRKALQARPVPSAVKRKAAAKPKLNAAGKALDRQLRRR